MSNLTKLLILLGIGLFLAAASIYFIGGKKRTYDLVVTMEARPYQLFPYLVEPELKKKWMSGLISETIVVLPTDDPKEVNILKEDTELSTVFEMDGEPVNLNGLIIRYAKNEIASTKYKGDEIHKTIFFRLKGNEDVTKLEYRRIVSFDGLKRFTSVFEDDLNQQSIEEEIDRLTKIIKDEVDNSIPDPEENLKTVGVDSENENSENKTTDDTNAAEANTGSTNKN